MSRRVQLFVAAGLGAVLAVLAAVAYATADVVEHGRLLPWAGADVRKVRVFDSVDFYISSETGRPSADLVNSYLLLAAAAVCLSGVLVLESSRARQLLLIAGLGIGYLSMDEQFAIHESVGHNLGFLADLPGVERPDDVIVASYLVPATLFVVYFWPLLRSSARAAGLLVATLFLFAAVAVWDAAGLPAEELVELSPSLALLSAFAFLVREFAQREKAAA